MSNDAVPAEERLEDETEMTVAAAAEVASEQDNAAPDFADDNADDESGDTADEAGEDDAEAAFAGAIRMAEALLFAAAEPLHAATLRKGLPPKTRVPALLAPLEDRCGGRGTRRPKTASRPLRQA